MRAAVILLAASLLAPTLARAADAEVLEHKGQWESGYGAKFYNVVGRLKNTSDHAVRWVKLKIEALDDKGKVVATTDAYNENAEALTVPEVKPDELLATGKVKPLAAGATERFRASFLEEETPAFTTYRVTVVEAPAAAK